MQPGMNIGDFAVSLKKGGGMGIGGKGEVKVGEGDFRKLEKSKVPVDLVSVLFTCLRVIVD
jgi:hypothetical protein